LDIEDDAPIASWRRRSASSAGSIFFNNAGVSGFHKIEDITDQH
jgi:hypothetical protein